MRCRLIPQAGNRFYVAEQKHPNDAKPRVDTHWYDAKLLAQSLKPMVLNGKTYAANLPTSREWSLAREYAQHEDGQNGLKYSDEKSLEKSYISGSLEFTGSLIAWPDGDEQYKDLFSPLLRIGKYAILIENPFVVETENGCRLEGGERIEVGFLSRINGFIQRWDYNVHLPESVHPDKPNPEFHNASYLTASNGLHVVSRGYKARGPPERGRFGLDTCGRLSTAAPGLGFRLGFYANER